MKTEQINLPGVSRSNHSNLGVSFEKEIEAANDWYRLQRAADVRKIPHNWSLISGREYRKLRGRLPSSMLARTDDGKFLQRVKSDVDFVGGGPGFAIAFDCKETKTSRFPLANLKPHQLENLKHRKRCGFISGVMLKLAGHDRVFFLDHDFLDEKYLAMLRQKTAGRAKAGTASIDVCELETRAAEIKKHPRNMLWDYLAVCR